MCEQHENDLWVPAHLSQRVVISIDTDQHTYERFEEAALAENEDELRRFVYLLGAERAPHANATREVQVWTLDRFHEPMGQPKPLSQPLLPCNLLSVRSTTAIGGPLTATSNNC